MEEASADLGITEGAQEAFQVALEVITVAGRCAYLVKRQGSILSLSELYREIVSGFWRCLEIQKQDDCAFSIAEAIERHRQSVEAAFKVGRF